MPRKAQTTTIAEETKINPIEPVITIEKDEFCNCEYIDANAKLPRIQALRGNTPDLCGYFINIDEMAKAGWMNLEDYGDKLITYTFESSGEQEQGLLFPAPRMLVCPRTPVLGYERQASQEQKQLVILGIYQQDWKEEPNISNIQYYEIFLVNEQNQPLHSIPLAYAAKGANGATFGIEWQKFITEMTNCHGLANGIAARPKDNRFKSLCVFACQTKRELVGDKQKSFACRVVGHETPTVENWKDYFLGFDNYLKQVVWEALQPTLPPMLPSQLTETKEVPQYYSVKLENPCSGGMKN